MTVVRVGVLAAVAMGMLSAGCGTDDSSDGAQAEKSTTPRQALVELRATRAGLDKALDTYRSGDRSAADRQVGDAYLEHFEHVEGPLGKADTELNEELEDSIREELRTKMKSGASMAQVQALTDEIMANLDKAEAALR